ncbi:uncharacterized protein LOC131624420 [Vicia villosa]|uniref:uncharacterized protein LOC131624420 n=1 Tax=Vicia villosa TaxID=3911 RepID=UPI00273ADABE|nr:uncharacterized protein LOC131624420 [Vicia villosa]
MGSGGGGGWKVVEGKQPKLFKDVVRGKGVLEGRRVSSFFFTSFANNLGAKDLMLVFQDYGEVHEVEILAHRSGRGNKFGFVRFFDVASEESLAVKLDNIFIGDRKLFVNLPRFQKREPHLKFSRNVGNGGVQVRGGVISERRDNRRDHRSFAMVAGAGNGSEAGKQTHMVFNCDEGAVWNRFNKAFVGTVIEGGLSFNMQDIFDLDGYFNIKVTPLGSNKCLLEGRGEGDLEDLLDNFESWLKRWFQSVVRWEPSMVDLERVVWVRAFGIPCHAWGEEFFECISKPVGSFIKSDECTRD